MIYTVRIKETLIREVAVNADSSDEAVNLIHKMYDKGEIVLGSSDHTGTSIMVVDNDVA